MAGFEPRKNNRGNFACPYCTHKAWKGKTGAANHIKNVHEKEAKIDEARVKAEDARRKAESEIWQERSRANRAERELEALKAKPKPLEQKRYSAVVYCPVCQSVDSVNIVRGQTIGVGGCFRCGNLGGQLVQHVNVHIGEYKIEGEK